MAPIVHQITVHISRLVVTQFLFLWLLALLFTLFCGLLATDPEFSIFPSSAAAQLEAGTRRSPWPSRPAQRIAGIGFVIFLLCYALLIFFKEHLSDFDEDVLWLILALLVLYCALLLSNGRHPLYSKPWARETPAGKQASLRPKSLADWVAAITLLLLLVCYLVLIFYRQDFAYYDDEVFTDFSLQGKSFAPAIWPSQGRFFPLEVQEFNYLSRVTRSAAGFHSFVLVQLLILLAALAVILKRYKVWQRALVMMAVLLAPSFLIPFMGLIYPERNVLFWLAILLMCLEGYSRTRGAIYFLGALVATHLALYYKEPVAVFVAAFAASRILLDCYANRRASFSWLEGAKRNSLPVGMIGVAGIFGVLFVFAMFPRASVPYVEARHVSVRSVAWAYMQTDWLLILLLVVFCVRLGRFLCSEGALDALWEPLAAGALGYFVSVFTLGLYSGYYAAPVDLIAVLYTCRLALAWLAKPTRGRAIAAASAFLILMLHNAAYSAFRVIETKGLIAVKAQFADYLESHGGKTGSIELFFPYATRFHLMEISSYLKYRGMLTAGQETRSGAAGPRVVIEGRDEYPLDRCVDYRTYECRHVESPRDGAWIVLMPDDDISEADVERAGQGSELVFSVKACGLCGREDWWLRRLNAISQEYWSRPLPEHWLQLDVFKRTQAVSSFSPERVPIRGAVSRNTPRSPQKCNSRRWCEGGGKKGE